MKKIIKFLILISVLTLFGCSKKSEIITTSYDNPNNSQISINTNIKQLNNYYNFDFALDEADIVAIIEVTSSKLRNNWNAESLEKQRNPISAIECVFKIKKLLHSNVKDVGEEIHVILPSSNEYSYYLNKTYLVTLTRSYVSLYSKYDLYLDNSSLVLCLNDETINKTISYTKEDIIINGKNISKEFDLNFVEAYISDFYKENVSSALQFDEEDIDQLCSKTSLIVKLKIKEELYNLKNDYVDGIAYRVELIQVLKGDETKFNNKNNFYIIVPSNYINNEEEIIVGVRAVVTDSTRYMNSELEDTYIIIKTLHKYSVDELK